MARRPTRPTRSRQSIRINITRQESSNEFHTDNVFVGCDRGSGSVVGASVGQAALSASAFYDVAFFAGGAT